MNNSIHALKGMLYLIWDSKELNFGLGIPLTILLLVSITIWAKKQDSQ